MFACTAVQWTHALLADVVQRLNSTRPIYIELLADARDSTQSTKNEARIELLNGKLYRR